MHQALKDAITISKTLLRNGYDAHVINAPLQEHLLENAKQPTVDIACEPDLDTLIKLFPKAVPLQGCAGAGHTGRKRLYFLFLSPGSRRSRPSRAFAPAHYADHDGQDGARRTAQAAHYRLWQPGVVQRLPMTGLKTS